MRKKKKKNITDADGLSLQARYHSHLQRNPNTFTCMWTRPLSNASSDPTSQDVFSVHVKGQMRHHQKKHLVSEGNIPPEPRYCMLAAVLFPIRKCSPIFCITSKPYLMCICIVNNCIVLYRNMGLTERNPRKVHANLIRVDSPWWGITGSKTILYM